MLRLIAELKIHKVFPRDRLEMSEYQISVYLENFVKATGRGTCKSCQKDVQWSKIALSSHKRASCVNASEADKRKFGKRKGSENNNNVSADGSGLDEDCPNCNLTDEQAADIDDKLASFFFRTGISFRVADSEAFKDFVGSLNPSYAKNIPSAKSLAGHHLDEHYSRCSRIIEKTLVESENLTLISDGWTNVRGDHIVNFCVKAPGKKAFFHSSINTAGITQNTEAVAAEIIKVLEKLGPKKFCSVITDNAPVMKAALAEIEKKLVFIYINFALLDKKDTTNYILEEGAALINGNRIDF